MKSDPAKNGYDQDKKYKAMVIIRDTLFVISATILFAVYFIF